jgi:putative nucleotidyltransferase with HDIG domain
MGYEKSLMHREKMNLEKELIELSIYDIKITHTVFFTLYMKRGDNFVPCVTEGSAFDQELKDSLIDRGITKIYMEEEAVESHTIHRKESLGDLDKKSAYIYDTASGIVENLFKEPTRENIQKSKEVVNDILDEILLEEKVFSSLLKVTSYDYYTYSHCVNVAVYSLGLGKYIGLSGDDLAVLGQAAILHDIGKSQIDSNIINKTSKLTYEEYNIVKKHPEYGYDLMSKYKDIDQRILYGIRHHHEKLNGHGYPDRLHGTQIHLFAQIVALADIFDALTTRRSYKEPMTTYEAFKLMKDKMAGEFDQKLFTDFVRLMSK